MYHVNIPETPFLAGTSDDASEMPKTVEQFDLPVDLLGGLGVNCDFLADGQAPSVDRDLLERLIRRELPLEQSKLVFRLLNMFRPWRRAFNEIVEAKLADMVKWQRTDAFAQLGPLVELHSEIE